MNRRYMLILAYVILILSMIIMQTSIYELKRVNGNSMYPTFRDKEFIGIKLLAYNKRLPKVNDIIAFRSSDTLYIKRIIAGEGNIVDYKDGYIYIDGIQKIKTNFRGDIKYPIIIEENQFFVMGDNTENSQDSRLQQIGLVDKNEILGKIR